MRRSVVLLIAVLLIAAPSRAVTRLYLESAAAPFIPAVQGNWATTTVSPVPASTSDGSLIRAPSRPAITQSTVGPVSETGGSPWNILVRRLVSAQPLAGDGAISGTLSFVIGTRESTTVENAITRLHIWVSQGATSTLRCTLLTNTNNGTAGTGSEWGDGTVGGTTLTGMASVGTITLNGGPGSCAVSGTPPSAGDYVVVELGSATGSNTTSRSVSLSVGGLSGSDLAQGITDMGQPGWIEFSQTFETGPTWTQTSPPTPTATFTETRTWTATWTATNTGTATRTGTITPTAVNTPTATKTPAAPDITLPDIPRCLTGTDKGKPCRPAATPGCADASACAADGAIRIVTLCDSLMTLFRGKCEGGDCAASCSTDANCTTGPTLDCGRCSGATSVACDGIGTQDNCPSGQTCEVNPSNPCTGLGSTCDAATGRCHPCVGSPLRCVYPCTQYNQCNGTCDTHGFCDANIPNGVVRELSQAKSLVTCGWSAQDVHWLLNGGGAVVASNPKTYANPAGPCDLVKGNWGHCSTTMTTACANIGATGGECPGGETCEANIADVIVDMCGVNALIKTGNPSACDELGPREPRLTDYFGQRACPVAKPTPGAYQCPRVTCTGSDHASCAAAVGTGSKCSFACEGRTDPVRPCQDDFDCSECTDDATDLRGCPNGSNWDFECTAIGVNNFCRVGVCSLGGGSCNVTGDCATGTCLPPSIVYPFNWEPSAGTCTTCTANDCDTAGTKYCTCPCAGIPCDSDDDCGANIGAIGGICNVTGTECPGYPTGACCACGAGGAIDYTASPQLRLLQQHRVVGTGSPAYPPRQQDYWDQFASQIAAATGALVYDVSYPGSWEQRFINIGVLMPRPTAEQMAREAQHVNAQPHPIDVRNAVRFKAGDLTVANPATGASYACGQTAVDCLHVGLPGPSVLVGSLISASWNMTYPVCSLDDTTLCGACSSPCTATSDCVSPLATTSGHTCTGAGNTRCECNLANGNGDCGAGCTCQTVSTGETRCVCSDITHCSVGNQSTTERQLVWTDALCPGGKGFCTEPRQLPACTRSKKPCLTTANCDGPSRGDVCALDGVWIDCVTTGDCRDTGGVFADDVCSPYPYDRTDVSKRCMQPTPTPGAPTPTATATPTPAAATWADNFNRADQDPLAGNWTQQTWEAGTLKLDTNTVVATTAAQGIAAWNANTPAVGSNYACMLLGGTENTAVELGPCTGVENGTTDDAVCCYYLNNTLNLYGFDNGPTPDVDTSLGAAAIDTGDYLMVVRTSATAFSCYWCDTSATACDSAADWTGPVGGAQTVNNIVNPGATGIFSESNPSPPSSGWNINAFGGGDGTTLPIPTSCAPNS